MNHIEDFIVAPLLGNNAGLCGAVIRPDGSTHHIAVSPNSCTEKSKLVEYKDQYIFGREVAEEHE